MASEHGALIRGMGGAKQHIHASAFHLREFAGDDGRLARVRTTGYVSHHYPEAVGFIPDALTDYTVPEEDWFWFEDLLGTYENDIAPEVKQTLRVIRAGRSPGDRAEAFTLYLALQYGRSNHQREWIESINARQPESAESLSEARARLIPDQKLELERAFPIPCIFTTEYGLAHPELPFVPFPDGQGVMLAMAPSVLFVRSAAEFNPSDAHQFYWQTLLGMPSRWEAVLCASRDAHGIAGLLAANGRA